MTGAKYWLLVFLSLVIAVLICAEIWCENRVAGLTFVVRANEAEVGQAQQQNEVLRQLVHQLAIEAQSDPALAELLTKRGIQVRVTSPPVGPVSPRALPIDANSAPSPASPTTHLP